MAATVLIQSTVSSVTAKYIRAAARADGMSVAAWVRRVLEAQRLASDGRTLESRVRELESRVSLLEGAVK